MGTGRGRRLRRRVNQLHLILDDVSSPLSSPNPPGLVWFILQIRISWEKHDTLSPCSGWFCSMGGVERGARILEHGLCICPGPVAPPCLALPCLAVLPCPVLSLLAFHTAFSAASTYLPVQPDRHTCTLDGCALG